MHRRSLSATSEASNASSSGARDGDESEEWRLKGHLEDLGRIGEGASGEVKKARHTPTGIVMAVKVRARGPSAYECLSWRAFACVGR
jgi:mitogen-activated protein kinase kinase